MKKVALVTGGARGIGLGVSTCLAKDGFALAVCGTKQESDVASQMESIRNISPEAIYCRCDISKADDRKVMLDDIKSRLGRLDCLINNAGVAPSERKDILEAGEDSFERLLKINLQGPYFLTQAAANWMVEQRNSDPSFIGAIINVSSISAVVASVNRGDYCISKAGVAMATRLWAVRLAEFGINVFEIRPGIIMTDMTSGVKGKYDKLIEDGLLLQSRWGLPEDIGKAVAMLCRGDMPYSTGSVINIDGGLTVQRL